MSRMKPPGNLDFNQDTPIDHEISSKESDFTSPEKDLDRLLTADGMPLILQNHSQRLFINAFQETPPKLIVDLKECSNNSLSGLLMLQTVVRQRLHCRR